MAPVIDGITEQNEMLDILDYIPEGFLEVELEKIPRIFSGPTLINLPGRRRRPLFVSILLHGNEETGLSAVQALLKKYADRELPRALSIFVGNIRACAARQRRLEGQPDYNRIWKPIPEYALARQVMEAVREKNPFACIDIHNNTGLNPHHSAVNYLDNRILQLATLFSRIVIYFTSPEGALASAFGKFCPAVTIECGQPGHEHGTEHTLLYLDGCLHMADLPDRQVQEHDIDLYQIVAKIKVSEKLTFGFASEETDIRFIDDLDHLNFRELLPGTVLGKVNRANGHLPLEVLDQKGNKVVNKYFSFIENEIRTTMKVMPVMLTCDQEAIRQDCLGYLMKSFNPVYS